jgi:SAM-dependent methyltransferase
MSDPDQHHARPDAPIEGFVAPHLGRVDLRRVTLSGGPPAQRKAVLRPVEVRGERRLQVVTYDERRSSTTNVDHGDDPAVLDLLRGPFRNVVVELADEVLEGRVTKKGKLVSSRSRRAPSDATTPDLRHDREKDRLVRQDAPFLQTLGLATADGRVKPTGQAKYRQIDEFVRLLDASLPAERTQLRVVDVGCGNAYVTFAAYHHLAVTRGIDAVVVGVDRNAELVERNRVRAAELGWAEGLRFEVGDIATFSPDEAPDVVIALHACDTASDHALAGYVRWASDLALVAPCCHHHLHAQLQAADLEPADALLLRHGVVRQQLGDTLTDTARAAILRLLGHDVDVVEFVAPEFTPKNTMLRARNRRLPVSEEQRAAYAALVSRYRVRPFLADLVPWPEPHEGRPVAMTTTTTSAPDLRGDAPQS